MKRISILMTAAVIATGCGKTDDKMNILIGTYGENIYVYYFDQNSLEFKVAGRAEARNASYALAGKGTQSGIYAVSETGDGSGVYSFATEGNI